jgi:hypothetical protein
MSALRNADLKVGDTAGSEIHEVIRPVGHRACKNTDFRRFL